MNYSTRYTEQYDTY